MTTTTLTTGESPLPSLTYLRREAADAIDRLIAFLDSTEPDPDLEPDLTGYSPGMDSREGDDCDDEDGNDSEPSLGSLTSGPAGGDQSLWGMQTGGCLDAEDEHSGEEPDIDEGSLGWTETVHQDGVNWHGGYHGDLEDEHDGREPDDDLERSMGWRNEGAQTGGWYQDHPELEAGSPEWPAEHPTWQPPKHRVVAPPVPVIPMSACVRVSA